ncbi:MAG: IS1182 family transposase [Vitreimonas sp.]
MAQGARPGLRLVRPVRDQVEFRMACLDDLIGADHTARLVWRYVEGLDLGALYDAVSSVEGEPGAPKTDPAVLAAVWLYAVIEGVGSARHVARLIETDAAFAWIMGGVATNHHTLSDFRTAAGPALDRALADSVAVLVQQGLVTIEAIAVDGMRVRAAAGAGSFKRRAKLETLRAEAAAHVDTLNGELDIDPGASHARVEARRRAAAQDRLDRIEAAQAQARAIEAERMAEAQAQRRNKVKQSRRDDEKGPPASTTDPDARVMRMADGGFRPAYNVQNMVEPESGLILAVDAISGGDRGRLDDTVAAIESRYGYKPKRLLADGGYDSKTDIAACEADGVAIYCPLLDNDRPRAGEPEGVAAWRARMQSEEGKACYAKRRECELPHAQMRNRGLRQFLVRGRAKVQAVALWFAHAHNFFICMRLAAAA